MCRHGVWCDGTHDERKSISTPPPVTATAAPPTANPTRPATPEPTPTEATTPSPATPSPSPTPEPTLPLEEAAKLPRAPYDLPYLKASLKGPDGEHHKVYWLANWGTVAAYVEAEGLQQLKLRDIATPNEPPLLLEDGTQTDSRVAYPVMDANQVLWVSLRNDGTRSLDWQIRRYDRQSGATTVIAEGLNRRREVGPAGVPQLALNGSILAYDTQADVDGQPEAQTIHLLDLSTGDETGSIPITSVVWDMALSDAGLIYSIAHGAEGGQLVDSEVWFARADGETFDSGPAAGRSPSTASMVWVQSGPGVTGDPDVQGLVAMTAIAS